MSEPHKHADRMTLLDIKGKAVKRMEWDNDKHWSAALQEAFQLGYERGQAEARKEAEDEIDESRAVMFGA